mgnify:FL=1
MQRLLLIFIAVAVTSCSFDNKTGIWKDATKIPVESQSTETIVDNNSNARYENTFIKNETFNEEKEPLKFTNVQIDTPIKIVNWTERYALPTNNISNFSYSDNKVLLFKSPKLSKPLSNKKHSNKSIVFYKNNLISHDHKGAIFIYSLNLNKKIFKYNFYKKKFKNFDKKIYLIVNENILYAADNLGYLYAINLDNSSIIWAKNYGIPFRSNLKFANNQIFVANQDNVIYSVDPKTGDKNWQFATSLTFLKSDFENTLALDLINNTLFFMNTSGELYSINYTTKQINWIVNFKGSSLIEDTELFLSQPIVLKNNNLIISTEKAILSYNPVFGSRNWSFSAEPIIKPIITSDYTFVVLKNNLLICLDNTNGNVVWSKNIFADIEDNKIIKNIDSIIDFKIVDSKIQVYFRSGHQLSFNFKNGNLNYSDRISKNGINSEIIFLNNNMFLVDSKNKLLKFN